MKLVSMLYISGFIVILFSVITIIMSIISDGENGNAIVTSGLAILNGIMAMGIAETLKLMQEKR